jgi:hypothetical protein
MYDEEKSYYLVNPHGTIHVLPDTLARDRLKIAGWRMATKEEIAKLFKQKGYQVSRKPIAPKWSPVPPKDQELPEQIKPPKKVK